MNARLVIALMLLFGTGCQSPAPADTGSDAPQRRIIDVHLHAIRLDPDGLAPGMRSTAAGLDGLEILVPETDDAVRDRTIAALRRGGVVTAVLSGRRDVLEEWVTAAPDLFLKGLMIGSLPASHTFDEMSPAAVGALHRAGDLDVLGEIGSQYLGMAPTDEILEPYFALAEERDIPVHIHTAGLGAWQPAFRSAMGRPLLLEPVIAAHPNLRIYLENAGYPFLEDMLALFFQYPERVYADVSTIIRHLPRQELYRYLKVLVDAGNSDRIMFGSDQVVWPQAIEFEIQVIEEAPFLTEEQKEDIFYNNAARFFRLDP